MAVLSIQDLAPAELSGKRVLVRVDFNVPLKQGKIQNDQRIRAALPTLRVLRENGATVILMSHLGRPKGGPTDALRLKPIGEHLAELIGEPVLILDDCVGEAVSKAVAEAEQKVILLENTRFYSQEEANDPDFARQLAALGDLYVNDAFGTAHRAHASTAGIAAHLPAYAGLLMQGELEALGGLIDQPAHPFAAIIGGAKVSTKLAVLENLLGKVDWLVIGGAMAYTFLAAQGKDVARSLVEPDLYDTARELLARAEAAGTKVLLPVDTVMATSTDAAEASAVVELNGTMPAYGELTGVDIGPQTIAAIREALADVCTVLWNGPMGVFENPAFAAGTEAVARLLAARTDAGATSVVGGGDSVAAVEKLHLANCFSHVSTGGGASLEFLEGKELPGVAVLKHG
ncbi:MAG: phosphoglycerate kinase [Candidatus Melainabacteria bacterium HGW-Melainabacteria-1]|nr:MAG: phosphoglycerate kinase [Candidatus Melainabacteria bacterium HGW-Melainabacteria-1]